MLKAYVTGAIFINDQDVKIRAVVSDGQRKAERDLSVTSVADMVHQLSVVLQKVDTVSELRVLFQPWFENPDIPLEIDLEPKDTPVVRPGEPFFQAWARLRSELAKVDAGILDANDKRVTDAREAARALDDVAYMVGGR